MTLIELSEEVSALGFDGQIPTDYRFRTAASRALSILFSDSFLIERTEICVLAPKTVKQISLLTHVGGKEETLPLAGRAYSMYVSGRGSFTVTDSDGPRKTSFGTRGKRMTGSLRGDATLTLSGERDFAITELTLYSALYGDDIINIPLSPTPCYDMQDLVSDFGGFVGGITDKYGRPFASASLSGSKITFPKDTVGRYIIPYRRSGINITESQLSERIDIPKSAEHLLALMTAHLLLIDDEPALAEHYLELYRKAPKVRESVSFDCGWKDNGWA